MNKNDGLKKSKSNKRVLPQRVVALKRFIEDYNSPWQSVFETLLRDTGGKFTLRCNFDTRKLSYLSTELSFQRVPPCVV